MARPLGAFVARLFGVEPARQAQIDTAAREAAIFRMKHFVVRRASKKYPEDKLPGDDPAALRDRVRKYAADSFPELVAPGDDELTFATVLDALIAREKANPAAAADIDLFERWAAVHRFVPAAHAGVAGWVSFHFPHFVDHEDLVPLRRPDAKLPGITEGPPEHRRRRDGFALTDPRMSRREVASEADYCLYCHEREKDSCSTGMHDKAGAVKRNPLGVKIAGCPLDEKIGEMHVLRKDGDSIAALAMIIVDNPMLPGTGHRICNDCMKGCVFQKQEPVNIPQAETGVLTDVFGMRWGFEIYGLFTRWNPLNRTRPVARPYIGKNVLVVGLGPAGFTLSHHLLNAGFGVVGIDGLKVEPLPADLIGADAWPPRAVERWDELSTPLDTRRLAGFGGVAEYGITVRWDKSFLGAIHLTLARRAGFRVYGGVRFGGTVDADEAFAMGFDHVAIAAGAGKPTIIDVKHNLIRGVRKASDFLMALQLTGAAKRDSLASLQVRLPAIVIGGGLTGIDTTTEAAAYYPVQVEKFLERWETLAAEQGEDALFAGYDAEEAEIAREFLEHGRAVRAERARAAAAGEAPDFSKLVAAWGGVSLVYRKGMADSPAYRLNHEEIIEFFEEGVRFVEKLSPLACVPDARGALSGVEFETRDGRQGHAAGAHAVRRGRHVAQRHLRARAAGIVRDRSADEGLPGVPAPCTAPTATASCASSRRTGEQIGFFTSYLRNGHTVTFYGDNNPGYAGSVVRAMASAKDGAPHVEALFARDIAGLDPDGQKARDSRLAGVHRQARRRMAADGRLGRAADADDRRGGRARARRRAPLRAGTILPPAELRGAVPHGRTAAA